MRALRLITAAGLLTVLLSSCGGGRTIDEPDQADTPAGLPSLADLAHQASAVDNDSANGSAYISAAHQTDSGTAVYLDATALPAGELAYAVYGIPERPGQTPVMLTANALYYDQEPAVQDETEGYWLAYGDFSAGGNGVWRFAGPFMQYQARVEIPASRDVINDSGNIFAAVVLADGARMKLGNVQVGYDVGPDYEQYRLAAPRGQGVGRVPQVVIDSDGLPQVAYMEAAINFSSGPYNLKIARQVAGEWQREPVILPYHVERDYVLACGANHRRALLVIDDDTDDLHMLWDGGGGTWTDLGVIRANYDNDCLPDLAFINGTDTPGGELDTVLALFGGNFVSPNQDIHYYEYDGVNPPVAGMFVNVRQPGKLNLMVEDSMATSIFPSAVGYPIQDCYFMNYSAAANIWVAPPILPLLDIDVNDDENWYGIDPQPLGSGSYVAGYYSSADGNINFSVFDGGVWSTPAHLRTTCVLPEPWLDFEVFADGTVVFPTHYNGFNLAVYEGHPLDSAPLTLHPFSNGSNNAFETSIAVDPSNVAHIVAANPASGRLDYFTYHQGGTLDAPVAIDRGQDGFGINYGPCGVVYTDDALHIFGVDSAHLRILHSENRDGVWVRESEPITPFDHYAYLLLRAGWLETTGQLYVAYIDGVDLNIYVSYTDPPSPGGWNWHTYRIASILEDPSIAIEDDETALGSTFLQYSPITGAFLAFTRSALGTPPSSYEPISTEVDICAHPIVMSYNKIASEWNMLSSDDEGNRTYLWHRAGPGNWEGPYVVAARPALNDSAVAFGITYHETSGLARVVAFEEDDALGRFYLNVYGQHALGSWEFNPPITFLDEDSAVTSFTAFGCVPDAEGNPLVASVTKPVADPTWDVSFYRYDGLGNWAVERTWASPLQSMPMEKVMFYPLATRANGDYAFAATEMDSNSAGFGRIWTYYPW